MSADVQIKTFYPYRQMIENNTLSYLVCADEKALILKEGGMAPYTKQDKIPPVTSYILPAKFSNSPANHGSGKTTYEGVMKQLERIFTVDQEYEKMLTCIFIIGTYCFRKVNGFPNLWLYVPRIYQHQFIESILKNLCFNAIPITNAYSLEATIACINSFDPTLIFRHHHKRKGNKFESLLSTMNSNDHFIPKDDLEIIKTYCPKIVLSDFLPPSNLADCAIQIIINRIPENRVDEIDCSSLRGELLNFAFSIQEIVEEQLKMEDGGEKHAYPIIMLASVLKSLGYIADEKYSGLIKDIEERIQLSKRHDQLSYLNDILFGVLECLTQTKAKSSDGYVPLQEIIDYLRKVDTIGYDFSPRLLSRFLNKYSLIKDKPKRKRVPIGQTATSSTTTASGPIYSLKTTVVIDEKRLNQLIYSDLTTS